MSKIAVLFIIVLSVFTPARAQEPQSDIIGWLSIPSFDGALRIYETDIIDGRHEIPDLDVVHLTGTAWLDTTHADLVINGGGMPTEADNYPAGRIVLGGHNPGGFTGLLEL